MALLEEVCHFEISKPCAIPSALSLLPTCAPRDEPSLVLRLLPAVTIP